MTLQKRESIKGFLLTVPFLLGFSLFYLFPFIININYTFFTGAGGTVFAGLDNYRDIFSSKAFLLSVRNTFRFILIGVPAIMLLSFALALILVKKFRGASFFRALFIYPLVIPIATLVMFVQAFFAENGLVNLIYEWLNLPLKDWLYSPSAFWILIGIYIWKNCGYNLVLFLAGLHSLPEELTEIAVIEGATEWQILKSVKIPLLIPNFFFIFIISIINSFKCFREAYLIGGANPHDSIYMIQHFMNNNFMKLNYPRLSVAALLTFLVIFLCVLVMFRLKKKVGDIEL